MGWCILVRKISSPFSFLISRLHSAYDLGGTAETEVFGEYYLKPEEEDVEIVSGAAKSGHWVTVLPILKPVLHMMSADAPKSQGHKGVQEPLDLLGIPVMRNRRMRTFTPKVPIRAS